MKRKFIYVSLFLTMSMFVFTSCGSSSEPKEELTDNMEIVDEEKTEETEEPEKLDVTSISSSDQAMDEYKNLLENYAELVKSGSKEEAEALKTQLDELKSYSEGKWGAESLKAMTTLSKYALQIEAGKDVDINDALKAYEKTFEVMKNMPGMDAETEKAMGDAQDAMKKMQNLGL
jgi:hypothetical protein